MASFIATVVTAIAIPAGFYLGWKIGEIIYPLDERPAEPPRKPDGPFDHIMRLPAPR